MANPAFSEKTFSNIEYSSDHSNVMTVNGSIQKTLILLGLTMATSAGAWYVSASNPALIMPFLLGGSIGGFILAMVLVFKKHLAATLAPMYAIAEGLAVGSISLILQQFAGIAILLTFGIAFIMLGIYRSGLIPVTDKLRFGITAATGAIAMFYLVTMILRLFGVQMPYLHDGGLMSIGISLVVIGVAAFNLLLDFDLIETGSEMGAPKYMEWYSAFGLLVTLIWLYLEILKLLNKLSRR
jgi:uncharacterized YccA/Bax inhibitor family protein